MSYVNASRQTIPTILTIMIYTIVTVGAALTREAFLTISI